MHQRCRRTGAFFGHRPSRKSCGRPIASPVPRPMRSTSAGPSLDVAGGAREAASTGCHSVKARQDGTHGPAESHDEPGRGPRREPGMSTQVSTSLNLRRHVSQTDRVRAHRRGRICAHEGCETILSIYNPAKLCAVHAEAQSRRRRGRARPVQEVACEQCGLTFEGANPHRRYCSDRCRMAAFARRRRAALRRRGGRRRPRPLRLRHDRRIRELCRGRRLSKHWSRAKRRKERRWTSSRNCTASTRRSAI